MNDYSGNISHGFAKEISKCVLKTVFNIGFVNK